MSAKTTPKRIAPVAVAALGFGILVSVAPMSAGAAVDSTTGVWASDESVYRPKVALNAAAVNDADISCDFEGAIALNLTATTGTLPSAGAVIKSGPGNLR
jgi:hypothetical protein